jgi:3-deoxy-7-phosphoheptulonate synthase
MAEDTCTVALTTEVGLTEHDGYPLVRRAPSGATSLVRVGQVPFGGTLFPIIAGPCAVETSEQISRAAGLVAEAGARVLRGGAFKPRTSPYAFQGLGLHGVELLAHAAREAGLPCVTEVMSADAIEPMAPHVDAFQVGARNMHNFALLSALGEARRPVVLKRGFGATLTEWLLAAEYLASRGNEQIILCERGVRSFGDELRYTLDFAGALWAKERTHLPVILDPSHATGAPSLLPALGAAALAAGLDGLMVEVHPEPHQARCDGEQALTAKGFRELIAHLAPFALPARRTL